MHHKPSTACNCPECQLESFRRNNYFTGKLMTARDFFVEQDYFRGKLQHHHQRLHGSGVVCGLRVTQHEAPECQPRIVYVEPGTAVDCCGREILVLERETVELESFAAVRALRDDPDERGHRLQLCIRYRECPTEDVPVLYDDCGCDDTQCAPNQILESFAFDVIVDAPDEPEHTHNPRLSRLTTLNFPHASRAALHAGSRSLYLLTADPGTNRTVFRVSTEGDALSGSRGLPAPGLDLAVSNDGMYLYVITEGAAAGDPYRLLVIATGDMTGDLVQDLALPGTPAQDLAMAVAPAPDNRLVVLLGESGDALIWPVELNDETAAPAPLTVNLGAGLRGLAAGSNAQRAFSGSPAGHNLAVLDLAGGAAGASIGGFAAGADPSALAVVASTAPDLLAVLSPAEKLLYLVDPDAPAVLGKVALAYAPVSVGVAAGGGWAYVLEQDGDAGYLQPVSLSRLRAGQGTAGAPVPAGRRPQQVIVSPGGGRVYVVYTDDPEAAAGGVAVFEVKEQACDEIFWRSLEGCPGCEGCECLVLVTVEDYRPGFRVMDLRDAPVDPAAARAEDLQNRIARIDNRLGRRLLPSVQTLAEVVQCLLDAGPSGSGQQGPPGAPGAPGAPGKGIDRVEIEWISCLEPVEDLQPRIVTDGDQQVLVLPVPDGCRDLKVEVAPLPSCAPPAGRVDTAPDGTQTLVLGVPALADLKVKVNQVPCDQEGGGRVVAEDGCTLVLDIPTGCKQEEKPVNLPHIIMINWPHDEAIRESDFMREWGEQGLLIVFDQPMEASTLNENTVQVLARRPTEEGFYCFCNLPLRIEPVNVFTEGDRPMTKCGEPLGGVKPLAAGETTANGVRFNILNRKLWMIDNYPRDPNQQQRLILFRVVVEGNFVLSSVVDTLPDGQRVRRALDGDHLGPGLRQRCPSGDGVEGGTFLSWFTISEQGRLNINRATRDELLALPGIGEDLADAILSRRAEQPFTELNDLTRISGIGRRLLERLSDHVTVRPMETNDGD